MFITRERINFSAIYLLTIQITLILWMNAKGDLMGNPFHALTQITGLLAVSFIGINLLLASRLRILENVLGGLDKIYQHHQLSGKIAFTLILAHPVFFILLNINNSELLKRYFLTFEIVASNWGKAALLAFIILITFAIFSRLSFQLWLTVHRLTILPVILTTFHVSLVSASIMNDIPLRFFTLGVLYLGIIVYVYKVLLYNFIGPKNRYKIEQVNQYGKIIEVFLSPVKHKLSFEPGQFVFVRFDSKSISHEEHPFSISSSPDDPYIRLSIKESGDFTNTLEKLNRNDHITLYGPYGRFGRYAFSTKKDLLFIAGGIGITPFLSITKYIKNKKLPITYKLIFTLKNQQDNPYLEELSNEAGNKLFTHFSETSGHLKASEISEKAGDLTKSLILLCGPKEMMAGTVKELLALGVKRKNIVFEDFDLKG